MEVRLLAGLEDAPDGVFIMSFALRLRRPGALEPPLERFLLRSCWNSCWKSACRAVLDVKLWRPAAVEVLA